MLEGPKEEEQLSRPRGHRVGPSTQRCMAKWLGALSQYGDDHHPTRGKARGVALRSIRPGGGVILGVLLLLQDRFVDVERRVSVLRIGHAAKNWRGNRCGAVMTSFSGFECPTQITSADFRRGSTARRDSCLRDRPCSHVVVDEPREGRPASAGVLRAPGSRPYAVGSLSRCGSSAPPHVEPKEALVGPPWPLCAPCMIPMHCVHWT